MILNVVNTFSIGNGKQIRCVCVSSVFVRWIDIVLYQMHASTRDSWRIKQRLFSVSHAKLQRNKHKIYKMQEKSALEEIWTAIIKWINRLIWKSNIFQRLNVHWTLIEKPMCIHSTLAASIPLQQHYRNSILKTDVTQKQTTSTVLLASTDITHRVDYRLLCTSFVWCKTNINYTYIKWKLPTRLEWTERRWNHREHGGNERERVEEKSAYAVCVFIE